ncbi:AlbA family DNA-binding domain-containing protein [Brucella pituitosa]|uniref:AlbA family DNA-binding domain-containing protein n=1 Tax=Brucella pituitosa TaxID=571256 RepID=UPI003F4ABEA8
MGKIAHRADELGKRSITDEEIGFIKAMLLRGMKNRDIQFYFNRQDRPVNSGRITQIKGSSYGPEVATATEEALNCFLSNFEAAQIGAVVETVGAVRELTLGERAKALFVKTAQGWSLSSHETERVECKESFCLKPEGRFADPLRSIAGLANNDGGMLLFGIKELQDGTLHVKGLSDNAFTQTDPSELNRCLAGSLHPVPVFSTCTIEFDGLKVGVIGVEKHPHPPVMAIKNVNSEVREGAVYFRYVGETRAIKPGELQQIIAYREQKAVAEFSRRITGIATGAIATLDLNSGKVEGRDSSFVIDEALLPKIQFLRSGEFSEEKGAPSLRLIGDVTAVQAVKTNTIRGNVTGEAMLLNFLNDTPVAEPVQYVLHSAHSARTWLPIFYYVRISTMPLDRIVGLLAAEKATYPKSRNIAAKRVQSGGPSAYRPAVGRGKQLLSSVLDGQVVLPTTVEELAPILSAIQAIPSDVGKLDFRLLKNILLTAYTLTDTSQAVRSSVYRASCRVDELEFAASFPPECSLQKSERPI